MNLFHPPGIPEAERPGQSPVAKDSITWPAGLGPARAAVYRRNELVAPVPAAWAWEWLIRPRGWSRWYRNAQAVRMRQELLAEGVTFNWVTFAFPISSVVDVFQPHTALGWKWRGSGAYGYHGWTLESHPTGCRLITAETQFGPLPRLLRPALGRALAAGHQYWLEALARTAAQGPPYSDGAGGCE
jgi:hypothetical protein